MPDGAFFDLLAVTLGDIKESIQEINGKLDQKLDKRDLDTLTLSLSSHEKRLDKLEDSEQERATEHWAVKRLEDHRTRWRRRVFEGTLSLASTAAIVISVFKP